MPFAWTGARTALRRLPRRPGAAVALLSVAILAAACTTSGGSSGSLDLTVAAVPGIDTAPLMIAVKDGLFTQQGITVTVKDVSSAAAAYGDLYNGSASVAAGDYSAFFYAISAYHAPLKLVTDGYDAGTGSVEVLTLPGSSITSVSDLVGKTVGTPSNEVAPYQVNFPYNIQTLAAESVLQSDGFPPSDVNWDPLPPSQMISALASHQVSAILASEPQITQAETQLGAVELFDACSGVTADLPMTGYFTTDSVASHDASALASFQAAMATAETDASNRSTVQSTLTADNFTAEDAALVNIGQYPGYLNVGQVQRVADLMSDSGMISSPLSVASLEVR
jgi:NitT/TauT family transport system substrate-binding protein